MQVYNRISSKAYNTFNIDVKFDKLLQLESKEDIYEAINAYDTDDVSVLGGGSNILLTGDVSKTIFQILNKGINVIEEEDSYALVAIAAGENWHDVVLWAIEHGYGGIENLALIPGNTGTAPIQNIGAYGVEIKDVLFAVRAFGRKDGIEYVFHNQECQFEYRNSVFKHKWKDQFIISEVILKLSKPGHHIINTSYGQINQRLIDQGIEQPSIKDVADTVIQIRTEKLPNPSVIGNAGSFFKNPIIPIEQFEELKCKHEALPSYLVDEEQVKLPAAWLIDQCGWKGKRVGDTGTYKNQALVLVNHGNANGQDVFTLSEDILLSVEEKFGVRLEREVNVWF